MKRRDFLVSSLKGIAVIGAASFLPSFVSAKEKGLSVLRIATPEDSQAIIDYWNANLVSASERVGKPLSPMGLNWLDKFFQGGYIIFHEDNLLLCVLERGDKSVVEYCWSSGVVALKSGLVFMAVEANRRNSSKITGIVRKEGSLAQFLDLMGINEEQNHGIYSTYCDTPDNFILKLS